MTDTTEVLDETMIDPVTGEIFDQKDLAERLLAQAREQGMSPVGPGRPLDQLTKNVGEAALDAELHVHDSGDARLLTRLLDHVFQRGLTVLATSNYAPDDLLPNPIWHHIFEPGIALIKTHMDVWNLAGPSSTCTGQSPSPGGPSPTYLHFQQPTPKRSSASSTSSTCS